MLVMSFIDHFLDILTDVVTLFDFLDTSTLASLGDVDIMNTR
jgi:hypothetical protein